MGAKYLFTQTIEIYFWDSPLKLSYLQVEGQKSIFSMSKASLVTRDLPDLVEGTDNVYQSVVIMSKRARQLSTKMKEELSGKLAEFATSVDNLDEVHENREQIAVLPSWT